MSDLMRDGRMEMRLLQDPDAEAAVLEQLARRALERARRGGAEQAVAGLGSSLGREVSVRLGEVESLEEARDRSLDITVYIGQCRGSASTGDLRPEAMDQTVDRALAIARHTQPDRAAGLADAAGMASEFPDLDLWHPSQVEMEDLLQRAREMEQAGLDADTRIVNSEGAQVSTHAGISLLANSHGFVGVHKGSSHFQSCVLIARDAEGMQRSHDYDARRVWGQLEAPEATGARAAERTLSRLGAGPMATGRMPVLFAPEVARGLISSLVAAVSGGNLYRRSSFLLDALGRQLLPSWAGLVERPLLPGAARSSSFDEDGLATREAALVEDGVLQRYVLSTYSARRLGLASTANAGGVRNLELTGGSSDFDGLLRQMGRGLVVTELMGQGVNLVTGDYSRGAAGFEVVNGQLGRPVEEVTIAGNLADMFSGLVAAGTDVDLRHNLRCGSLLIGEMTVAGAGASA